jgi:small-conductance mechanosensitive channel/CRP-like cAMP-binding protein
MCTTVGQLAISSPFTGTWMRLATAVVGLVVVALLRRTLPPEQRHHGNGATVLLSLGLLLGLVALLLASAGAQASTTARVVGMLATFFVALGTINVGILLVFEVLPRRSRLRAPTILRDIIQMLSLVVILFGALSGSGAANVVSFITTSAVLTAVIGLSMQTTLANLFAGVVLHMDRALSEGDWIQVGSRTGHIVDIRWRSTILRTTDGDNVILPNSQLLSQEVYNFSRPLPKHRLWVRVALAYRHPPSEVRRVLAAAVRATPGILPDPPADCVLLDFTESAIIYAVRCWISDFAHRVDIEGEVRARIWYAAQRAGLDIPLPTREPVADGAGTGTGATGRLPPSDIPAGRALLEQLDLFVNLEAPDRERLAQSMRLLCFGTGEPIITQGEPGDSLFIIARGQVQVSLAASGIEQVVATLRTGDFFGEMSLLTGEPRAATCSALTDVVCYTIDHRALKPLLAQRPQLAEHLSSVLVSRQAALEEKGGELSARAAARTRDQRKRLLTRIRAFFELR